MPWLYDVTYTVDSAAAIVAESLGEGPKAKPRPVAKLAADSAMMAEEREEDDAAQKRKQCEETANRHAQ